jgi:hypothetical protein
MACYTAGDVNTAFHTPTQRIVPHNSNVELIERARRGYESPRSSSRLVSLPPERSEFKFAVGIVTAGRVRSRVECWRISAVQAVATTSAIVEGDVGHNATLIITSSDAGRDAVRETIRSRKEYTVTTWCVIAVGRAQLCESLVVAAGYTVRRLGDGSCDNSGAYCDRARLVCCRYLSDRCC